MSEIRANTITDAAGTGAPSLPNGLSVADGTAAAPSITNIGDTDTGIYFPSANMVGVSTGGALRAYLDSGGLYVTGQLIDITGNFATLRLINNGGLSGYALFEMYGNGLAQISVADSAFTTGQLSFTIGGTERFRMGGAGQLGIGGANYGTSGQVLTSGGSGAAPSWTTPSGAITLGTAVPSSGAVTTITFSGIPAGVNRVTLMFTGVSTNGTSSITVSLGTSAGIETSGYLGSVSTIGTGAANGGAGLYFIFGQNNTAASVYNGSMIFSRLTGNTWVMEGIVARSDANSVNVLAGSKALAGVLDRVSISTVIGNAFDAGTINISYEA